MGLHLICQHRQNGRGHTIDMSNCLSYIKICTCSIFCWCTITNKFFDNYATKHKFNIKTQFLHRDIFGDLLCANHGLKTKTSSCSRGARAIPLFICVDLNVRIYPSENAVQDGQLTTKRRDESDAVISCESFGNRITRTRRSKLNSRGDGHGFPWRQFKTLYPNCCHCDYQE
jgi:hypothetical protein